jgi:hypothetical protein
MGKRFAPELEQLLVKCGEFRMGRIAVEDLQAALWGTAEALTARDDRRLRERLQDTEGRMELVRFTVEKARIFDEVLKILDSLESEVRSAIEEDPA